MALRAPSSYQPLVPANEESAPLAEIMALNELSKLVCVDLVEMEDLASEESSQSSHKNTAA